MAYDPRPVEPRIYKRWLDAGAFQPREGAEPYVIVIPPPNVTDILHVGHALNNVIQDVLIRFERLRGRVAAGDRSRRYRDPERGREAPRQGGEDPVRSGP